MAARKKPLHQNRIAEMREKIRATLLVKRLENYALAQDMGDGHPDRLTEGQVRSALGLLAKILPNVTETKTEVSGTDGGAIPVSIKINFK